MNDLQVVLVVHKAIIKKVHVASGEDYVGCSACHVQMWTYSSQLPSVTTGIVIIS